CGYWYHRELVKRGAVNFVVVPRPLGNQRAKGQKTDRLDARALLDHLDSYLRGNREAMSLVAVPSPEQEQRRSLVRYREQLMRNRRRAPGTGPSARPDPRHSGPGGLVAARGLGAVSAPAARVAGPPAAILA